MTNQVSILPNQAITSQVSNLRKSFVNNSSADIKVSKMIQLGGFLGRLLGPILKTGLSLIKSVIKPLLILESGHNRPSSSASSNNTTLIVSNNEMEDIIKIVKSLEDSGLLLKGVTETVQNEIKDKKGGFLSMLLCALGASLLRNLLTGKGICGAGKGKGMNRAGEGIVRAGYGNNMDF